MKLPNDSNFAYIKMHLKAHYKYENLILKQISEYNNLIGFLFSLLSNNTIVTGQITIRTTGEIVDVSNITVQEYSNVKNFN